jgi:D-alanyl-D-alanine dipeptidase
MNDLVYIDRHGLLGSNFYWHKHEAKGITKEEILSVGLTDDRVQVHADIIGVLQDIDRAFQERGYRLFIKEGYRSKDLYELVYRKRVEKFGKEETDRLINMKDMPHADGKSVDVALVDKSTGEEVHMRRGRRRY